MKPRAAALELDADDSFQKTEWRVQRVGWVVWALLVVAGFVGLLGPGALSNARSTSRDDSLSVAYDRFLHYHHPAQLRVTLRPSDATGREVQLKLDHALLDRLQVHSIQPEPERRELAADGVVYTFLRTQPWAASHIVFHVEFERFGPSSGRIQLVGSEAAVIEQFVYP